jgi:hypothetical protein
MLRKSPKSAGIISNPSANNKTNEEACRSHVGCPIGLIGELLGSDWAMKLLANLAEAFL